MVQISLPENSEIKKGKYFKDKTGSKNLRKVNIYRWDPSSGDKPRIDTYEVDMDNCPSKVLDILNKIKNEIDPTLAYRRSCAHGVCGSDAMVVNGENMLACQVLVKEVSNPIKIEPIRGLPVIKDLVVDMETFFESYKKVMPYLINEEEPGERERLQSPEDRDKFEDTTKCILCAACTTSCPVFWTADTYVGPAAIVNAHRFVFDSRDNASKQRLEILKDVNGAFRCRTAFNCTTACPRGIQVTKAIEDVKRETLTIN